MEKSSSQDESEKTPKFHCHLCDVYCASALNLQSHFLGVKHKKVEDALRKHVGDKVKEVVQIDLKPNVTLQEHIDVCKDSEPAIGLEYVYQYQRFDSYIYECKLCDCRAGLSHMFMHIVGAKHRIAYLDKHHPTLGIRLPFIMRGRKLKKLREACIKVEREFGRQKIQVMDGIDSQWTFNTDTTCAERTTYVPDTEPGKMDFTSDDFFDTEKKPEATEDEPEATEDEPEATEDEPEATEDEPLFSKPVVSVTFLELKAAYEESQKALSDNVDVSSEAEENDTEKKEDSDGESNNETSEKEHSLELWKSDQGFRNSKELFNYLEHFTIVEEEDIKFVNTVVEMLATALLQYHKSRKEEKMAKSDATIEQDKCKEQVPEPSNQESQNQSKTQLHPIPKAGDRKKLKFTLSNKAQESEENFAPEAESSGPTTTFNPTANVFSKDRKREDTPETNTQNQNSAASQYNNRKPNRKPQPSSSLVSVQTPAYPPPQVNIRPPFAQTRFAPPHAPFPSRPPLFPIAKDDVVNKFFESIKTMDVGEVASTLSRITATNPAFKGINVPSLIRYLTETGKLKTPQSMQQMNQ